MIQNKKKKNKKDTDDTTASGGRGKGKETYKDLISPETLTAMMKDAIQKDVKNGIFTQKQGEIMLKELAKAQEQIQKQNKTTTR